MERLTPAAFQNPNQLKTWAQGQGGDGSLFPNSLTPATHSSIAGMPFQSIPQPPIGRIPGLPMNIVRPGGNPSHPMVDDHLAADLQQYNFTHRKGQMMPGHLPVWVQPDPSRAKLHHQSYMAGKRMKLEPIFFNEMMQLLEIYVPSNSNMTLGRTFIDSFHVQQWPADPSEAYYMDIVPVINSEGKYNPVKIAGISTRKPFAPRKVLSVKTIYRDESFLLKNVYQPLIHGRNASDALDAMYAFTRLPLIGFMNQGFLNPAHDDLSGTVDADVTIKKLGVINDIPFRMRVALGDHLYFIASFQPNYSELVQGDCSQYYFCKDRPDLQGQEFDHRRHGLTAQQAAEESYVFARLTLTCFAMKDDPQGWTEDAHGKIPLFNRIFRSYPDFPVAIMNLGRVTASNTLHNVPSTSAMPYAIHPTISHYGTRVPSNILGHSRQQLFHPTENDIVGSDFMKNMEPMLFDISDLQWEVKAGHI